MNAQVTKADPSRRARTPVIGAAILIIYVICAAGYGRLEGLAKAQPDGKPTAERTLAFADRPDGAVVVTWADQGRVLDVMTGQNGFLRGTLRGFARTRRADKVGSTPPMRLSGYADGRLILSDPSTGRYVELEAFGSANEAVFARLLTMTPRNQTAQASEAGRGS
jgi:putative photosynthetic complex assembly protein